MTIRREYRVQSILETELGVIGFTIIGVIQAIGLLVLADNIPLTVPNPRNWPKGIAVDNLALPIIIIFFAFAAIFYIIPRTSRSLYFKIGVGSFLVFGVYLALLALFLAGEIGIYKECTNRCFRHNFWFGAASQGLLLALSYSFWLNQLDPDIPHWATDRLEIHLRKWERVFQMVFSIILVSGFAVSTQYILELPISNPQIFWLLPASGPTFLALILFAILKVHIVTEKIQRGLEMDRERNRLQGFLT